MTDVPDYVRTNRESWNAAADEYATYAETTWAADEPVWGIFSVPEADVGMLPADLEGKHVLEAGCGTGYVSAWMARRGARPVGIDNSPRQLATAVRFQDRYDLPFPLIQGIAEQLPFRDETFDLVISEYGASLWSDPYRWIPEAARVLRPGGELVFLSSTAFVTMFIFDDEDVPADRVLKRDYFGTHSQTWPDDPGVEFHLTHGDWFTNLDSNGFDVVALIEVRPGPEATTSYPWVRLDWARRWPVEEVWKARKRG
jgi:SAM-dependent methyltransferase